MIAKTKPKLKPEIMVIKTIKTNKIFKLTSKPRAGRTLC
jgi:hypothetical protein